MKKKVLLLMFISVISIYPQYKNLNGKIVPKDYIINETKDNQFEKSTSIPGSAFSIIKDDFVVNSGYGDFGSNQERCHIESASNGNVLCAWLDDRIGNYIVYAQLFDEGGNKIGNKIRVSDGIATFNSEPHVIYNKVIDEFLIVWANSGDDITYQKITNRADRIGNNGYVNEVFRCNVNNPSGIVTSEGNYIITWTADRGNCDDEIAYYRMLNAEAAPKDHEKEIFGSGEYSFSSGGWQDRIAADSLGNSVVVWSAFLNSKSEIYMQKISYKGELLDDPILVSNPSSSKTNVFPVIAATNDGNFFISWDSDKDGTYSRIFNFQKGFISEEIKIFSTEISNTTLDVTSDGNQYFYVVAQGKNKYSAIISTDGTIVKVTENFNYDSPITWLIHPRLSRVINNKFVLGYYGTYKEQLVVYLQYFNDNFISIGKSIRVDDDTKAAAQVNPLIKTNMFGNSIIVWEDYRNGQREVFAQVIDKNGNPIGKNINLNQNNDFEYQVGYAIDVDNDGNFIIAFIAQSLYTNCFVVSKIKDNGSIVFLNKIISERIWADYINCQLKMLNNNEGIVFWREYTNGTFYSLKFNINNNQDNLYEIKTLIENDNHTKMIYDFDINSSNDLLLMWHYNNYCTNIDGKILRAVIINPNGETVRDTFVVAEIGGDEHFSSGSCAIDDNRNLAFIWKKYDSSWWLPSSCKRIYNNGLGEKLDELNQNYYGRYNIDEFKNGKFLITYRNNSQISGQYYNDNLEINFDVLLHSFSGHMSSYGLGENRYSISIKDNKLLFVYESTENIDNGFEIMANIQDMGIVDFSEGNSNYEKINIVYPNPANGYLNVKYSISRRSQIVLSIHNILGEEVKRIVNTNQEPGSYSNQINISSLASGVYILNLKGVETASAKFVVLK